MFPLRRDRCLIIILKLNAKATAKKCVLSLTKLISGCKLTLTNKFFVRLDSNEIHIMVR